MRGLRIEDFMIDLTAGKIAYAVLSFGGVLGMGNKLFAIPWEALDLDSEGHNFVLGVDRESLEQAPGFDKDHWPDMANRRWADEGHDYYGVRPYWH
jgi:hypothetical protein